MRLKKKSVVEIGPYKVTVDAEDAARVSAETWTPIEGAFIQFVTDVGAAGNPVFRTLGQFILGVEAFVDLKDRTYTGQLNYRKSNLKS